MKDKIELYIQSKDIVEGTAKQNKIDLLHFGRWMEEKNITLTTLQTGDIIAYKKELEQNYKGRTLRKRITTLKSFFSYLEYYQDYQKIFPKLRFSSPEDAARSVFSISEIKQILNSIDRTKLVGMRDYCAINLMLRNGLRAGEITEIKRTDIVETPSKILLYVKGKGHRKKDTTITLTEQVYFPILNYIAQMPKTEYLFVSFSNQNKYKKLTYHGIYAICIKHFNRNGYKSPAYTPHSLRTSGGVMLAKNGEDPYSIMVFLRHKAFSTTQIYLKRYEEYIKQVKRPEYQLSNILG